MPRHHGQRGACLDVCAVVASRASSEGRVLSHILASVEARGAGHSDCLKVPMILSIRVLRTKLSPYPDKEDLPSPLPCP